MFKLRRGRSNFDVKQLCNDGHDALDAYPSEQLEKLWKKKSAVLKKTEK